MHRLLLSYLGRIESTVVRSYCFLIVHRRWPHLQDERFPFPPLLAPVLGGGPHYPTCEAMTVRFEQLYLSVSAAALASAEPL